MCVFSVDGVRRCGGAEFFSRRALRAKRRERARERGNGKVRGRKGPWGPIYRLGRRVRAAI